MTPLEQQFTLLQAHYPAATTRALPSGATAVIVPGVRLPGGWNRQDVDVKFVAPVGYPVARPDCFWVNPDLRLQNGNLPQAAQMQVLPETQEQHLWFSWHLQSWNPNADSLLSYFHMVMNRLGRPQ